MPSSRPSASTGLRKTFWIGLGVVLVLAAFAAIQWYRIYQWWATGELVWRGKWSGRSVYASGDEGFARVMGYTLFLALLSTGCALFLAGFAWKLRRIDRALRKPRGR